MWLAEIHDSILYNHQHGISQNKLPQGVSEVESLFSYLVLCVCRSGNADCIITRAANIRLVKQEKSNNKTAICVLWNCVKLRKQQSSQTLGF